LTPLPTRSIVAGASTTGTIRLNVIAILGRVPVPEDFEESEKEQNNESDNDE
jgi:hypothetical protein